MEVYEGMVKCYIALDRVREALTLVKELYTLTPKDPKALVLCARVLMRVPERQEAAQQLIARALAESPGYMDAISAQVDMYVITQKPAKAVEFLGGYIERQPDNDVFHTQLGRVCEEMSELEEAKKHYERALLINPQNHLAVASLEALKRLAEEEEDDDGGEDMYGDDDDRSW